MRRSDKKPCVVCEAVIVRPSWDTPYRWQRRRCCSRECWHRHGTQPFSPELAAQVLQYIRREGLAGTRAFAELCGVRYRTLKRVLYLATMHGARDDLRMRDENHSKIMRQLRRWRDKD